MSIGPLKYIIGIWYIAALCAHLLVPGQFIEGLLILALMVYHPDLQVGEIQSRLVFKDI